MCHGMSADNQRVRKRTFKINKTSYRSDRKMT